MGLWILWDEGVLSTAVAIALQLLMVEHQVLCQHQVMYWIQKQQAQHQVLYWIQKQQAPNQTSANSTLYFEAPPEG